jgi:hypothetical protein
MGGCKIMKGLKKFIAVSFVAVAVLGLATTASAKKPVVNKKQTVYLFKEKSSSPNNAWWVDKATSLIPIKNLKWNAKVFEISVNNKKCCIEKRAVGAYYLNICAAKTVKPGDQSKVSFVIKQDGNLYIKKVTINFKKAPSPLKLFKLSGIDALDHAWATTFDYTGIRTIDWTRKAGITEGKLEVKIAAPQTAVKIVGCLPCGKEIKMYSGNMYDFSKLCSIKVIYKTTKDAANANYFNNYFKAENDSFAGTKRFPVEKYCLLNIK